MGGAGRAPRTALEGLILTIAGAVAGSGLTLVCVVRNRLIYGGPNPTGSGEGVVDLALYSLLFGLMCLWMAAVVLFVKADVKNPVRVVLALVALGVFFFSARGTFLMAYPVCNAM